MPGYLWQNTRELHQVCEDHPVGQLMAQGNPGPDVYSRWLSALYTIHCVIDAHVPECAVRVESLLKDLTHYSQVESVSAAEQFATSLETSEDIDGATYVLLGAHLMGGEILKRRLSDYPTSHLEWQDRRECLQLLEQYRHREELLPGATRCFQAILDIMDEIHQVEPLPV